MDLERTPRLQLELEPPMKSGVVAVPVVVTGLVTGLVAGLVEGLVAPCRGLPRHPRARPGVPSVRDPLMGLL